MKAQPVFAVAIALISLGIMARHVAQPSMVMADFRAFACTGSAVLNHIDPYASSGLAACEASAVPRPLYTIEHGAVLPAPVPGYLVAAFVPFAVLPFVWSATVWGAVLCLAILVAIVFLQRLGLGTPWMLTVVMTLPLLTVSVPLGELAPIAMAGIAVLAWGVKERRNWPMAVGLALAMAEPQVGICAAVAVLALSRRHWIPVGATLLVLSALSAATIGMSANVEYVRSVVPASLYAELPSAQQFSLSWILDRFGAPVSVALLAGRLWYVLMLVLAVTVARARAAKAPEFAVLAAAALAVLLGPYTHLSHIALALPAALWLARYGQGLSIAVLAIVALSLPLLSIIGAPALILLVAPVAGWIAASYSKNRDTGLRAAAAATIVVGLVAYAVASARTKQVPLAVGATSPVGRAEYVRRNNMADSWSIWPVKLPTWCGLSMVCVIAVMSSLGKGSLPAAHSASTACPETDDPVSPEAVKPPPFIVIDETVMNDNEGRAPLNVRSADGA